MPGAGGHQTNSLLLTKKKDDLLLRDYHITDHTPDTYQATNLPSLKRPTRTLYYVDASFDSLVALGGRRMTGSAHALYVACVPEDKNFSLNGRGSGRGLAKS